MTPESEWWVVGVGSSSRELLQKEVGAIVKALNKQLREKSVKTRVREKEEGGTQHPPTPPPASPLPPPLCVQVGALSVLKELVVVLPSCLQDHFASLVPGIQKALNDKASNGNLKIEALQFTHLVCASHPPSTVQPHVNLLLKPVLAAVGEQYYKVTAEALRVCAEFVKTIRPDVLKVGIHTACVTRGTSTHRELSLQPSDFTFQPFVKPIYEAIMKRLTAQDQDQVGSGGVLGRGTGVVSEECVGVQEVKECAIFCMGLVVAVLGDQLGSEMKSCLALLLERLRNEITRLTAVKVGGVRFYTLVCTLGVLMPSTSLSGVCHHCGVWFEDRPVPRAGASGG